MKNRPMKKRTILLAIVGCFIGIAVLDRITDQGFSGQAWGFWRHDRQIGEVLDLGNVSKLRVDGAASEITVTADPASPPAAKLTGERDGWGAFWQSGWSTRDCGQSGRMHVDNDTLVVEMSAPSRFLDWSDCSLRLTANLKPEAAVLIRQQAARITLKGNFSTVDVKADAGDFSLDGHAQTLDVAGAALRVQAWFRSIAHTETIALTGRMMDASLHFMVPTPISYLVEATASLIDSQLPNTPGAKPSITIRGEMVRTRID